MLILKDCSKSEFEISKKLIKYLLDNSDFSMSNILSAIETGSAIVPTKIVGELVTFLDSDYEDVTTNVETKKEEKSKPIIYKKYSVVEMEFFQSYKENDEKKIKLIKEHRFYEADLSKIDFSTDSRFKKLSKVRNQSKFLGFTNKCSFPIQYPLTLSDGSIIEKINN